MDTDRLSTDRVIDPSQLDLAAATQADVFFHWAEQASKARIEQDRLKVKMDLVENRLALQCRRNPEEFDLAKVTEAAIQATVKSHPDYVKVVKRHLDAREETLLLECAVAAMEQRKRMIEILVTLHGQQYFAGPSVPRDLVSAWNDYQSDQSAELTRKQGARSRRPARVAS